MIKNIVSFLSTTLGLLVVSTDHKSFSSNLELYYNKIARKKSLEEIRSKVDPYRPDTSGKILQLD